MSRAGGKDLSESFTDFLSMCARVVMWLGVLATVGSVGLLVFTIFQMNGSGASGHTADAIRNVALFKKVLSAGVVGIAVGSTYLMWGEELLAAIQLIAAAVLYFAPLYLPMVVGGDLGNEASRNALGALQEGGTILGAIGIVVMVADVFNRVRNRAKTGVKADQMKYGKGVKEESDKQNIFMGKCWQLPYCRKFVRERCPIYHSKRTCWKEKVGCMCEEEVIRNAMENKPIPKDSLLNANMIPRNHRLTDAQKMERCRNCVIYNEHQRHKYKLALPVSLVSYLLIFGLLHGPLIAATKGMVVQVNRVVNGLTLHQANMQVPGFFVELLLAAFFIIALTYTLKMLEFAIFKLKI